MSLSVELNDIFETLMESVLNNLTENVCYSLLNLFVDSQLDIWFRISNILLAPLSLVIENFAVTLLVQVQDILRADKVAFARFYGVLTFDICILSLTATFSAEDWSLTKTLLLAIELGETEWTIDMEMFALILAPTTHWLFALLGFCHSCAVADEDLCRDHSCGQ